MLVLVMQISEASNCQLLNQLLVEQVKVILGQYWVSLKWITVYGLKWLGMIYLDQGCLVLFGRYPCDRDPLRFGFLRLLVVFDPFEFAGPFCSSAAMAA